MTAPSVGNALQLHPKVAGGTLSGAVTICVLALLQHWNITVGDVTAGAITVIVTAVGGWLSPISAKFEDDLAPPPPA